MLHAHTPFGIQESRFSGVENALVKARGTPELWRMLRNVHFVAFITALFARLRRPARHQTRPKPSETHDADVIRS